MAMFRAFGGRRSRVVTNFLAAPLFPPKGTRQLCTKTLALDDFVSDRCKSESIGLEEALGLFIKCLKVGCQSASNFDQLLGVISMRNKHYVIVLALAKVMNFFRIQPSFVTLSIVTDCYCHLGRVDLGFSVFGNILKLGFVPTLDTLSSLFRGLFLDACVEKLQEHETRDLFIKALTTTATATSPAPSLAASSHDFASVFDALMLPDGEACKILKMATQMGQDPVLLAHTCFFHSLLLLHHSDGEEEEEAMAMGLCNQVLAAQPSPLACTALFHALCKQGMLAQAQRLLVIIMSKQMMSETQTNQFWEAYMKRIRELAPPAARRGRDAVNPFPEEDIAMYGSTAVSLLHKGMWNEAVSVLDHMKHTKLAPEDSTLNTLLQGCLVQLANNGKPVQFIAEMIDNGFSPGAETVSLINQYIEQRLTHISRLNVLLKRNPFMSKLIM